MPGANGPTAVRPAGMSSTTGNRTGTAATSAARTAYPSIAELSNGGSGTPATTSRASTRPRQSATGRSTTGIIPTNPATRA